MLKTIRDRGRLQREMFLHDITGGRLGGVQSGAAILPHGRRVVS
jgi:hypothetical protein